MASNIKDQIIAQRKKRILREGYTLGVEIPEDREAPLVEFGRFPLLICEVKRKSPSKGNINLGMDAVTQAGLYYNAGVRSVSVLTEEDHFGGSLQDLRDIKKAFPDLALLRKDFLIDLEDIEVSYRAGADAVLLIASALPLETLVEMYNKARALGMQVLFEVHDAEDFDKANKIKPDITGINCRNLANFHLDLGAPILKNKELKYPGRRVFESGIFGGWSARMALSNGFNGLLVGEAVVKDPSLIEELLGVFQEENNRAFWKRLLREDKGPLIKICGLTREEDVLFADQMGADILGFIFAGSPRRTSVDFLRTLRKTKALKVAVVVDWEAEKQALLPALEEGLLDGVQFHGHPGDEVVRNFPYPFYTALEIHSPQDWEVGRKGPSVRHLVDAFHKDRSGNSTPSVLQPEILEAVKGTEPLWLAGGLTPANIREIVRHYQPELVDVSSGVEESPGIKSKEKVRAFFEEINRGSL